MAGRSGAALIDVELREAARTFDAAAMAKLVRTRSAAGDDEVAAALDAVGDGKPERIERLEGEMLAHFGAAPDGDVRKCDVTELCAVDGYGIELQLSAARLARVSFYQE